MIPICYVVVNSCIFLRGNIMREKKFRMLVTPGWEERKMSPKGIFFNKLFFI